MAGDLSGSRAEFTKLNTGAKICAGVCCCLVSILSVLGVAFLVTLSILTNKVAPFMAEAALGMSSINITNATVWHPTNTSAYNWAEQVVHVKMNNPGPFSVTLKEFTQKMVMRGDYRPLTEATNVTLATYKFPETHLKPGENDVEVSVNMTLNNGDDCAPFNCFNIFQIYVGRPKGFGINAAFISLESEEMKVKSLGLTVKGVYSQTFKMNCKMIGGGTGLPEEPLNVSDEPVCKIPGGCQPPVMLSCWMVGEFTTTTTTTTKKSTTTPPSENETTTTNTAEEMLL